MNKLKKFLDKVTETVCIIIFMLMTVVGTYQIVTRYIFNSPSTMSEELLTYSFTWLALLAAAYVFGKRDHMRMSFFAERFSERNQIILSIVLELIIVLFSVFVLIYGGLSITKLTMTQQSASLGIPMGYVYAVIPLCGFITIIYNVINIYDLNNSLSSMKKGDKK